MDGFIPLHEICTVTSHDQMGREVITLYGTDASGRVWMLHEGHNWTLVGNPTVEDMRASTPE